MRLDFDTYFLLTVIVCFTNDRQANSLSVLITLTEGISSGRLDGWVFNIYFEEHKVF